jgi:hypothetical protein
MKTVVYTAIFGKKDSLHEPTFIPEGCDFICFTDQDFESQTWHIVKVTPPLADPTRSARKYKILPHVYLQAYDRSIWIDGNVLVEGDVAALADVALSKTNIALGDVSKSKTMPASSLKEELGRLLAMEKAGKHQDDAALMEQQYKNYIADGYPDTSGLAWTMIVMRNHLAADVSLAMERWWQELEKWSKRDQMSFNYVAWKTGLQFSYLPFDPADNPYFKRLSHYLPPRRKLYAYWIGLLKRFGL